LGIGLLSETKTSTNTKKKEKGKKRADKKGAEALLHMNTADKGGLFWFLATPP